MAKVLWFEPIDVKPVILVTIHHIVSGVDIMDTTKLEVAMETPVSIIYRNQLSLLIVGLPSTNNVLYCGSCNG